MNRFNGQMKLRLKLCTVSTNFRNFEFILDYIRAIWIWCKTFLNLWLIKHFRFTFGITYEIEHNAILRYQNHKIRINGFANIFWVHQLKKFGIKKKTPSYQNVSKNVIPSHPWYIINRLKTKNQWWASSKQFLDAFFENISYIYYVSFFWISLQHNMQSFSNIFKIWNAVD